MINLRRILTATDFSDCSKKALDYALYLANLLKADLYLVHVFESPLYFHNITSPRIQLELQEYFKELAEEDLKKLNTLVSEIAQQHKEVHSLFKHGNPFVEILKAAQEIQADLIVLGTHGRTGLAHFLIGSVAERVVRQAPCPVFTVRPEAFLEV